MDRREFLSRSLLVSAAIPFASAFAFADSDMPNADVVLRVPYSSFKTAWDRAVKENALCTQYDDWFFWQDDIVWAVADTRDGNTDDIVSNTIVSEWFIYAATDIVNLRKHLVLKSMHNKTYAQIMNEAPHWLNTLRPYPA